MAESSRLYDAYNRPVNLAALRHKRARRETTAHRGHVEMELER
jgi:hypothetical protein